VDEQQVKQAYENHREEIMQLPGVSSCFATTSAGREVVLVLTDGITPATKQTIVDRLAPAPVEFIEHPVEAQGAGPVESQGW
jgi:hypothetical protein